MLTLLRCVCSVALLCVTLNALALDEPLGDKADPAQLLRFQGVLKNIGALKSSPKFVTALTLGLDGHVWIATEGNGVWRYDPAAKSENALSSFKDSFEENVYAMERDTLGRIWYGGQFGGVSVLNKKVWATYDRLSGPLGERVYAIKCCKRTGDVWVATNCGLSRYVESRQVWLHYTRMDGLPSVEIGSVAFDSAGNLYAGTLSDGVVMASAADDYKGFQVVRGAEKEPLTAAGAGLPSNLIECVLVSRDDVVYVGTQAGLARSSDRGKTWGFNRGHDYAAKAKALIEGVPAELEATQALLSEDWVSCLSEDHAGMIWIGHRMAGFEVFNPATGVIIHSENTPEDVRAILPLNDLPPLIGSREKLQLATKCYAVVAPHAPAALLIPALPVATPAPNLEQLNGGLRKLHGVPVVADKDQPKSIALENDCFTRGAWVGRYGKFWSVLCNMRYPNKPWDYTWGTGEKADTLSYRSSTSFPGKYPNYYYDSKAFTDNERTLELPPALLDREVKAGKTNLDTDRRESEWNDGGWKPLPMEMNGPNLVLTLEVPAGNFVLSVYNHNKDGQRWKNRYRDFLTRIRMQDGLGFEPAAPVLAYSRIKDFWGGAYQRFLVRGPGIYSVEITRNHSHCAQAAGFMLDSLDDQMPFPYEGTQGSWDNLSKTRAQLRTQIEMGQQKPAGEFVPAQSEAEAADALFERLEATRFSNSNWWASERRRFYTPLARWYIQALTQAEPGELSKQRLMRLGTCYYHMGLFKQWEDCRKLCGQVTPRQIEKGIPAPEHDQKSNGRVCVMERMADANQKPEDPLSIEGAFALLNDASPRARIRGIDRLCTSPDPRATGAALAALGDKDPAVAKCAADVLELRKLLAPTDQKVQIDAALKAYRLGIFDGRLKVVELPKVGPAHDEF